MSATKRALDDLNAVQWDCSDADYFYQQYKQQQNEFN